MNPEGRDVQPIGKCVHQLNPLIDMNDVLHPVSANNFPAIPTDELPQFLAVLHSNEAYMQPITRIGLR